MLRVFYRNPRRRPRDEAVPRIPVFGFYGAKLRKAQEKWRLSAKKA